MGGIKRKKKVLIAVALVALAGAVIAAVSVGQHMRIRREGFEKESFCAISERINCDIVNASSYSEFLGSPVAGWGFVFYLIVCVMAVYSAFSKRETRPTIVVAWLMSAASILYSAYLAYISAAILGILCVECIAMYVVNTLLFILLFFAQGVCITGLARFLRDYVGAILGRPSNLGFSPKIVSHVIAIVIATLIGFGAMRMIGAQGKPKEGQPSVDEEVRAFYMQSLYSAQPSPTWAVWGNVDAKVTIVEFSEFQCPFCKLSAFSLKPYLQEFRKDVRYYFVNYPLDNACNDQMDHPMHPMACFAAKAGICAKMRGDFWSFHDDLFRNQRGMTREKILELAKARGWDPLEFEACINSPEVDEEVKKEIEVAKKIYVNATPTILLNNRRLKYWRDPKFLQAVVREEIKRAKKR